MRLESVTLRNYRMHRELSVTFGPSRTVIGGPNEAGKSTLVEAIHRVLFLRHSSTVDLDAIRPRHETATPSVTLEFERHGQAYELHKVFKGAQGSVARLVNRTTGERLAGDEAEQRLRELLGVAEVHPTKFKGQWSHLWVWQGRAADDPTTPEALNSAGEKLRTQLNSLSGTGVTESPHDSATLAKVVALHAATFTADGRPKASSELHAARQEEVAARSAATEARNQLQALEQAAAAVDREQETLRMLDATLDAAARERAVTAGALVEVERLEAARGDQEAAAKAAAAEYEALVEGDASITAAGEAIAAARRALAPRAEAVAGLKAHERRTQEAAADATAAMKKAFDAHQEAAARQALLQAIDAVFTLATRRAELEATCRRVADWQADIGAIDAELRTSPAIDAPTVESLSDLDRRLAVARAALEAIATRIEVTRAAAGVTLDGAPLGVGDERLRTESAELVVDGTTAIRITPGGSRSVAEVRATIVELESDLGPRLAALGVPTCAEARRLHETRLVAEKRREQLGEMIAAIDGAEVMARLRKVNGEIEAAEADIARRAAAGFERPADAGAAARLLGAAAEHGDRVAGELRAAQKAVDETGLEATAARKQREAAEQDAAQLECELQRLEWEKARLEAEFGVDRTATLEQLAAAKQRTAAAAEETGRALAALKPDAVRADLERLDRAVANATRDIAAARERQAEARGQLRKSGTLDLHGSQAAADARLDLAVRRLAEVERRAQAVRRLKELFEARRQAVCAAIAAPLRHTIAEYLDDLYGAGSQVAVTWTGGGLDGLRVARPSAGGIDFDFEALSGGTREQVAAACRLAMAEILAGTAGDEAAGPGGDGCLPIVFDDAFANSDPERIRAVQRVLDRGARRGLQVIVLSCNPEDYGLLGADRVDLPPARSDTPREIPTPSTPSPRGANTAERA